MTRIVPRDTIRERLLTVAAVGVAALSGACLAEAQEWSLRVLPGTGTSMALGISDSGRLIAGFHHEYADQAVVWFRTAAAWEMRVLPIVGEGRIGGYAVGIHADEDLVTGYAVTWTGREHPFVYRLSTGQVWWPALPGTGAPVGFVDGSGAIGGWVQAQDWYGPGLFLAGGPDWRDIRLLHPPIGGVLVQRQVFHAVNSAMAGVLDTGTGEPSRAVLFTAEDDWRGTVLPQVPGTSGGMLATSVSGTGRKVGGRVQLTGEPFAWWWGFRGPSDASAGDLELCAPPPYLELATILCVNDEGLAAGWATDEDLGLDGARATVWLPRQSRGIPLDELLVPDYPYEAVWTVAVRAMDAQGRLVGFCTYLDDGRDRISAFVAEPIRR